MRDRTPFDEIERFFERMSKQFEETAEWPVQMRRDAPVDVVDAGAAYEVRVDLPGFQKDDVELTLSDATLRVRADHERAAETDAEADAETDAEADAETDAETAVETDVAAGHYVRRERRDGAVDRTVTLPEVVDEDSVEATLADGVLTVSLEKAVTDEDAKSIDIA